MPFSNFRMRNGDDEVVVGVPPNSRRARLSGGGVSAMLVVLRRLTLFGSGRCGESTSSSFSHSLMNSSSDFLHAALLVEALVVPGVPVELKRDREWKNSLAATGVLNENSSFSISASNFLSSSL